MNEGNTICYSCFEQRKNSASNFYKEEIVGRNWGFYMIPLIGVAIALAETAKYGNDGHLYHVYINGYHEKWVNHYAEDNDLKKCYSCNNFKNSYYKLLSKE